MNEPLQNLDQELDEQPQSEMNDTVHGEVVNITQGGAHVSIDAGYTTPGGGVVSLNRNVNNRSETIRPFTDSAGYVAQYPSAATFFPPAVAMFHTAGTLRSSLVIGSRC